MLIKIFHDYILLTGGVGGGEGGEGGKVGKVGKGVTNFASVLHASYLNN